MADTDYKNSFRDISTRGECADVWPSLKHIVGGVRNDRRNGSGVTQARTRWSGLNSQGNKMKEISVQQAELIERVLDSPPEVHPGAASGVWNTSRSAYRFIGENCLPGSVTLEIGLGVSTVLFAAWSARHICVVHHQSEVDVLRQYFAANGMSGENVEFMVGPSDRVLSSASLPQLDFVLIDGSHAFPHAILDWYFACSSLRAGGHLLLDDTNMESVSLGLVDYLRRDSRWKLMGHTLKWRGYRRLSAGVLSEPQEEQEFLNGGMLNFVSTRVPKRLIPVTSNLARRFRLT